MDHVIYIPGLNDQLLQNKLLVKFIPMMWNKYGVVTHIFEPHWSEDKTFQPKLEKIVSQINSLAEGSNRIYLIGQSAGGAAALNAFALCKNRVKAAISINGRLRRGNNAFPSLDLAAKGNRAFKDSVLLFEKVIEKKLTKDDRKRIMIIHPLWDDIVPIFTAKLERTTDVTMPIITHALGGIFACTVYAKKMMSFLKQNR